MTPILMASITGTGTEDITGSTFPLGGFGKDTVVIQTEVGTSVTSIVVNGRLTSSNSWFPVYSTTIADIVEIPALPQMQAVITDANGLCTVRAWFGGV